MQKPTTAGTCPLKALVRLSVSASRTSNTIDADSSSSFDTAVFAASSTCGTNDFITATSSGSPDAFATNAPTARSALTRTSSCASTSPFANNPANVLK